DLEHQGAGAGHGAVLTVLCELVQQARRAPARGFSPRNRRFVASPARSGTGYAAGWPRAIAASRSAAVTGPRKRRATLPSGAISQVAGRPRGASNAGGGS